MNLVNPLYSLEILMLWQSKEGSYWEGKIEFGMKRNDVKDDVGDVGEDDFVVAFFELSCPLF